MQVEGPSQSLLDVERIDALGPNEDTSNEILKPLLALGHLKMSMPDATKLCSGSTSFSP